MLVMQPLTNAKVRGSGPRFEESEGARPPVPTPMICFTVSPENPFILGQNVKG